MNIEAFGCPFLANSRIANLNLTAGHKLKNEVLLSLAKTWLAPLDNSYQIAAFQCLKVSVLIHFEFSSRRESARLSIFLNDV